MIGGRGGHRPPERGDVPEAGHEEPVLPGAEEPPHVGAEAAPRHARADDDRKREHADGVAPRAWVDRLG